MIENIKPIENKNALKFNFYFEEEENEEMNENNEDNEDNEDENLEKDCIIQVELFKLKKEQNEEYLLRFLKKSGDLEKYYNKLEKIII